MTEMNIYSVLAATFASFIFGALWYSPMLFMKRWSAASGIDPTQKVERPGEVYGSTFLFTLISATAFELIMGPQPDLITPIIIALLIGVGITSTSLGINYQFAQRTYTHWLIDSGFHVGRFLIIAIILALWP
jgi:hypothetical protein